MSGDFLATRLDDAIGWARKFSLFHYPFITACCGMEYMSTACAHFDLDRFGAGLTRFSPRQADLLMVVGTISMKLAPVLRTVYDQMTEPKWVVAFGTCTVSGGIYDNYAVVQGIDTDHSGGHLYPGLSAPPGNRPRRADQAAGGDPAGKAGVAMGPQGLIEAIAAKFPGETGEASVDGNDVGLTVRPGSLLAVARFLLARRIPSGCFST